MSGDDREDHSDGGGGGDDNDVYLSYLIQGLTPPGPVAVWDGALPDGGL